MSKLRLFLLSGTTVHEIKKEREQMWLEWYEGAILEQFRTKIKDHEIVTLFTAMTEDPPSSSPPDLFFTYVYGKDRKVIKIKKSPVYYGALINHEKVCTELRKEYNRLKKQSDSSKNLLPVSDS